MSRAGEWYLPAPSPKPGCGMWVGSQGRAAPLLSLREASKTTIFLLGGGAGKGQFSLYPDSQVRHRLGFKFRPDICPVTHISFPSRDLTSSLFGHTQRDVLGAPAWGRGHCARATDAPRAAGLSGRGRCPRPPSLSAPLPRGPWLGALRAQPLGPHCPPRLIRRSGRRWRRAPQSRRPRGGPGPGGPARRPRLS